MDDEQRRSAKKQMMELMQVGQSWRGALSMLVSRPVAPQPTAGGKRIADKARSH